VPPQPQGAPALEPGGLLFSSNWDGAKTVEQNLSGGNLTVK
jgi:hypothetical protein